MATNLIPLHPHRPAVVTIDGWTEFVSIHDAYYLQEVKAWKRKLAAAHPDKGGTGAKFRMAKFRRACWQQRECAYYARLGLLPPDGHKGGAAKASRFYSLRGITDGSEKPTAHPAEQPRGARPTQPPLSRRDLRRPGTGRSA